VHRFSRKKNVSDHFFKEVLSMAMPDKIVDGFRFMPPSLKAWIGKDIPEDEFNGHIPWTPFVKPLTETTFSLMTTAGISMKKDPPFNVEREKREPLWGDPTSREIPADAGQEDINVNHLHINTGYIKQDINVMLPLTRFAEFAEEGRIGRIAPTCYSFYGFQFDPSELLQKTLPKVAEKMHQESVDAVLLTPA
jgi:D-proline reductase (dithiol) PrdB